MLTPVFSAAHLRNMTHIFYDIAYKLQNRMGRIAGTEAQEIDVNGWMSRATLEMLGQAGLGYSFDDFTGEATDAYGKSLKSFLYVDLSPVYLKTEVRLHSSQIALLLPGMIYLASSSPTCLISFRRKQCAG